MASLNTLAHATLRRLLENPDTPPAVQLRAAQTVLKMPEPAAAEAHAVEDPQQLSRFLHLIPETFRYAAPKPGRNLPCPCGSGRKFKFCCRDKPAAAPTAAAPIPNTT